MKVAITGASGHIGNVLCRELAEKGMQLRILLFQNKMRPIGLDAEVVVGSILDKKVLEELISGCDVVYHLAAKITIDNKERDVVFEVNVQGTKNVIEVCLEQNVKRLIYTSSVHSFKSFGQDEVLDENNPVNPESKMAYEASKAKAEMLILEAVKAGLNAVILNPSAIIGPFDYQPSYLGQALIKIYKNNLPMLVSGGYDFVDVRDVVDAAINAATMGRIGERYILSGQWLSLKELSEFISRLYSRKTPTFIAPMILAKIGLPFIHAWAKLSRQHPLYTADSLEILKQSNKKMSHQKAEKELGYHPRPIEKTLKDTLDWFKSEGILE
jgi:dihydroflavonol-4-reductase